MENPGVLVCVLAYLSDLRHDGLGQSSADVRLWWAKIFFQQAWRRMPFGFMYPSRSTDERWLKVY